MWYNCLAKGLSFDYAIDLACGTGGLCFELAKLSDIQFREIHGFDINRGSLALFEKRNAQGPQWNLKTHRCSIQTRYPDYLEAESADFIGCKSAFYVIHQKHVRQACENMTRFLASDGVFFFPQSFMNEEGRGPGNTRHKWNPEKLSALLEETGLATLCEKVQIIIAPDRRTFHVVGGPSEKLAMSEEWIVKQYDN